MFLKLIYHLLKIDIYFDFDSPYHFDLYFSFKNIYCSKKIQDPVSKQFFLGIFLHLLEQLFEVFYFLLIIAITFTLTFLIHKVKVNIKLIKNELKKNQQNQFQVGRSSLQLIMKHFHFEKRVVCSRETRHLYMKIISEKVVV